jgi:hypothetical protein
MLGKPGINLRMVWLLRVAGIAVGTDIPPPRGEGGALGLATSEALASRGGGTRG